MPSDARTLRALEVLAAHRDRYRSAVSAAHDQMASYLAAHRARTYGHAQTAARELGRFAMGRIDTERFGALFAEARVLSPEMTQRVERLVGVLAELLAEGDDVFVVEVQPGGDLRSVVDDALAHAGRVFGAVVAFQAVKAGTYRPERQDADLLAFPFREWNRAERRLAPPLVVEVDGADLRAEALAEFVDGGVQIVLVARGASTPAPLVRLITPGTLVMQGTDVDALSVLAAYDGPAVGALLPPASARFVHDPRVGGTIQSRLTVSYSPAELPKIALGARSPWQQREELAQLHDLRDMATAAAAPAAATPQAPTGVPVGALASASESPDPQAVNRLTSWLLTEAGLGTITVGGGVG